MFMSTAVPWLRVRSKLKLEVTLVANGIGQHLTDQEACRCMPMTTMKYEDPDPHCQPCKNDTKYK